MGGTQYTGRLGEDAAAEYLLRAGYRILDRNFACRFGELDIVAAREPYLVFVEVKTRKNAAFAAAREYVTAAKQRRVRVTAEVWLSCRGAQTAGLQPRFDVIEVYAGGGTVRSLRQIEDAF